VGLLSVLELVLFQLGLKESGLVFVQFLLDGMCAQSWELLKLRPKDWFGLENLISKSHNIRKQDLVASSSLPDRESTVLES
jgi:hypothetical protein